MVVRYFTDQQQIPWRVWAVRPAGVRGAQTRGHVLPSQWQQGWLVFEPDGAARPVDGPRRLAPIPADWESCAEAALAAYLGDARRVERRTG